MSTQVTVKVGKKDFKVNLPNFQREQLNLEATKKDYLAGNISFQPIWSKEDSEKELVIADLNGLIFFLLEIESNPDLLIPHIEKIRKKKNGDFWKNSGTDVLLAENCSEYFTDFTNAWSVLMIRLDVETNDTCTLDVRHRTFTY